MASLLDPRTGLAMALHAQPGVYSLLLGSGVSTGAQVPTGWGVVEDLVQQVRAQAADADPEQDVDSWWAQHGDGKPLGYSSLLEMLAPTPAARRALLARYFEPTDQDREDGIKVPSRAHHAIAALVARRSIRVILTTNFDRLMEQALDAAGVTYQVVHSPGAISGMEPLQHASCTIVKLHGDYTRVDVLNTAEELSAYAPELEALLDRVLDEYGLVIAGWSGDWDVALGKAIERRSARRYPTYWSSMSAPGLRARQLVDSRRMGLIQGDTADQFFSDVVARLEALDVMSHTPLSKALSLARLKRLLPDPARHIELRDLFDTEMEPIRALLIERSRSTWPATDIDAIKQEHDRIVERCDTLLTLLANGVYLDRDRQHTELWVWVIERLMRARVRPENGSNRAWDNLNHYPSLLALHTGCAAAVAVGHDDVMLALLRQPTWKSFYANDLRSGPAFHVLNVYEVLDNDVLTKLPRMGSVSHPVSSLLRGALSGIVEQLEGDSRAAYDLFSRTEYRMVLVSFLFGREYDLFSGEFINSWQWDHNNGKLTWDEDFRLHADRAAWGWDETEVFESQLDAYVEKLRTFVSRH